MGTFKTWLAAALVCAGPAFCSAATLGVVRVSLLEGDVQVRTPDSGEWVSSSVNTALGDGDEVWVSEDGRVELQLSDGSYVRLDHDTALGILSTDKDASQFYLSSGRIHVYCDGKPEGVLQFDTPLASVRARGRGSFGLETGGDDTDVSVYKGSVDVEQRSGETRVNAGKMLSLGPDADAETSPLGPLDDWERWNRDRNTRLLSSGPSARYLPADLRAYESDFDENGEWESSRDYGRVWVPRDAWDSQWSPYRNGRWIWRGGDYVWVGHERWGWAPYHYGRWAFVPPFGWCWVPPPPTAVIWGPGFVGWVRTPEYVGWVPLAPRETYYGRGDYGPHSVNVMRGNVTRWPIDHEYRNGRARNGVTIVHHDHFVTGTPPPIPFDPDDVRRRIFKKQNFVIGVPPIPPGRGNFRPIVKEGKPVLPPPRAVEKVRLDEVKRERRLVRDPRESALRPGTTPAPLPVRSVDAPRRRGDGTGRGKGAEDDQAKERRGKERETREPGKGRDKQDPPGPGRYRDRGGDAQDEPAKTETRTPEPRTGREKKPGSPTGVDGEPAGGNKGIGGTQRREERKLRGPKEENQKSDERKTEPRTDRDRKPGKSTGVEGETAGGVKGAGSAERREKKGASQEGGGTHAAPGGDTARDKRSGDNTSEGSQRGPDKDADTPGGAKSRKNKGTKQGLVGLPPGEDDPGTPGRTMGSRP